MPAMDNYQQRQADRVCTLDEKIDALNYGELLDTFKQAAENMFEDGSISFLQALEKALGIVPPE